MPLIPRRGLLAITAVVDVALHADRRLLSAKTLANRYRLAPRHLEPLMQALVHANILRGIRGPRGGYMLARPTHEITLYQILTAALPDSEEDDYALGHHPIVKDVVLPTIATADRAMAQALNSISVAVLVAKASHHYSDN